MKVNGSMERRTKLHDRDEFRIEKELELKVREENVDLEESSRSSSYVGIGQSDKRLYFPYKATTGISYSTIQ